MTFENLVTFCKDFGIFPVSVSKQDLLCLYQSFLHSNFDESTFDLSSLILLLGVVALQYTEFDETHYSSSQKLLILFEKMSVTQTAIDKRINKQMKNHASFQRPMSFI